MPPLTMQEGGLTKGSKGIRSGLPAGEKSKMINGVCASTTEP